MHRIAILAIILGVAVGIAGGVFAIEAWIDVGEGVAMAGIVALYCLAIGKKPIETLKAQAEVETLAAGYPQESIGSPPSSSAAAAAQIGQTSTARESGTATPKDGR